MKEECPVQLFPTGMGSIGGKFKSKIPGPTPAKKPALRTLAAGVSHPITENFLTLIWEAKEALGNKQFGVSMLLQNKAKLRGVSQPSVLCCIVAELRDRIQAKRASKQSLVCSQSVSLSVRSSPKTLGVARAQMEGTPGAIALGGHRAAQVAHPTPHRWN
jgi:hypothetical protein